MPRQVHGCHVATSVHQCSDSHQPGRPKSAAPCGHAEQHARCKCQAQSRCEIWRPEYPGHPSMTNSQRNSLRAGFSLPSAKGRGRPHRDVNIVLFSLSTKPNIPSTTHATAMAFDATDLRCDPRASDDSKVENRPASKSATPTRTALRKASRREAFSASLCSMRRNPSRSKRSPYETK